MATFTNSLPQDLLDQLNERALKLSLPKNKLIERALRIYLDQLNRAEYIKSYTLAGQDKEVMEIAEEGMHKYLSQLNEAR